MEPAARSMKAGVVRTRNATPRPLHPHVSARLGPARELVHRALAQPIVYVWQRGYQRNTEAHYRIDWRHVPVRSDGLGDAERPTLLWMNYARHRLCEALDAALPAYGGVQLWQAAGRWATEAAECRNFIVEANLGLAKSLAQRVLSAASFEDRFGCACVALIRAVDAYDAARGVRLSTLAFPAILRDLLRLRLVESRYDKAFPCSEDPDLDRPVTAAFTPQDRQALMDVLYGDCLTDREREVVCCRLGIGTGLPETLESIAAHYRLSKERVRQIEAGALRKLRAACGAE